MFTLIEDTADFIVISKHPGANFHRGTARFGLVMNVRDLLKCPHLYPIHRLDTMTSGLLVFARTLECARELSAQFRERRVVKFYLALAGNNPKKKQGTVKGDMIRSRNGMWVLSRTTQKPAITQFFSAGMGNGLRLYLLKPHTGRTHQLRVAMKSIGVPVFGDPLYFGAKNPLTLENDQGYLHAFALQFEFKGKLYRYIDRPAIGIHFSSDAFLATFEKFKDPWSIQWPKLK